MHARGRFSAGGRLAMLASGGGLVGLLAIAWVLQPDPSGIGTHRQLGLPPCAFRTLTTKPCPGCGMTTSWAHLVRGDVAAAAGANAGGLLLGILAIVAGPGLLIAGATGKTFGIRQCGIRLGRRAWMLIASVIVAVTLAFWILRLIMYDGPPRPSTKSASLVDGPGVPSYGER